MNKMKSRTFNLLMIFIGVIAFFIVMLVFDFGDDYRSAQLVAATAVLMSILWITEALPLAVTALIPLILFPLTGAVSANNISEAYMNSTIFLFMGGFIIAIAMERWNLHKRIALNLIYLIGTSPSKIILGFMLATAFISMWISNTATALMILPIGLAILLKMEDQFGKENTTKFSTALMLSIAYSASIGGMGTLIGTPPNLVFARIYKISFPDQPGILFGDWMKFAIPIMITMLFIAWLLLTKVFYRFGDGMNINRDTIKSEKLKLGKMSFEEKAVLAVFLLTSVLWIFRSELNLGLFTIPGWTGIFPNADYIDDGTIAITMAVILFLIPARSESSQNDFLLDFSAIPKIPWDIILLFGGGFALAEGFVSTGLSKLIGQQFAGLSAVPIILLIAIICFAVTALSELTSNTATAQIVLPILASLSIELNIEPMLLMIPATLAASFGFMLPVGTPPNAIVFSSKRFRVIDMVKTGVLIDVLSVLVITFFIYLFFTM
jgi:solute carrier family 13 (sodium-dependent dicarboxylate transporter), member 2/3/5